MNWTTIRFMTKDIQVLDVRLALLPLLQQRICAQADGMVWRKQNADCMNKELQNGISRYFI